MLVFSVLCCNFFSWRFAGARCGSSLRDEPATPFCAIDHARSFTLGDWLHALSEFDRLRCALLYCAPSGRSFAYMWGAGLRAHLKFSTQRGKIRTQRARGVATHAAAAPCEQTEALDTKRASERAQQRHANCRSLREFGEKVCFGSPTKHFVIFDLADMFRLDVKKTPILRKIYALTLTLTLKHTSRKHQFDGESTEIFSKLIRKIHVKITDIMPASAQTFVTRRHVRDTIKQQFNLRAQILTLVPAHLPCSCLQFSINHESK